VVKARTWFTLFMVSFGTVAATASCGSDEATGGGSGAGNIISGGGNSGSGGKGALPRAGSGGMSTGGGPSTSSSLLGAMCSRDSECGGGDLICVTANSKLWNGGGPSQGMCTKACDPNAATSIECDAVKPGAACADFGTDKDPQGYCLDSCVTGPVDDINSKCSGRSDFICYDFGSAFCVPHCRSDAECGAGLYCDKSSLFGLCSTTKPPAGDPVGTACDPDADPTTCEQGCLRTSDDGVTPKVGVCTDFCSIGSECMYGPGQKSVPGGLCVGRLTAASGPMDLGYCMPNCECTSDCFIDGQLCRKWGTDAEETALKNLLGAPGLCYPVVTDSSELTCAGGAGGTGGAGGAGGHAGVGGAGGHGGMAAGGSAGTAPATGGSSAGGSETGGAPAGVAGGG